MTRIDVDGKIHLSEITPADKPAYLKYLNERAIYENTCRISYPYTEKDADAWIARVDTQTKREGRPINWAIRQADGELIGGIGFVDLESCSSYRAEVGYWLAKPYWNRGIMTAVVNRLCEFAFKEFKLLKITAQVFESNEGSSKVLERCGFKLEGVLQKHQLKDGKLLNVKLYGRLKPEA